MTRKSTYFSFLLKTLTRLGLIVILLVILMPASYGQNTKGDKPQTQRSTKRENKFRQSKKKVKTKNPYNRVQGRRSSQASRAVSSKPPKVYSQKGRFVNNRSSTAKISKQNARKYSSRVRSTSSTDKISRQNARKYSTRVRPNSATGKTRNTYPQRGRYVNNPSRKPRSVERPVSNKQIVARVQGSSHRPDPPKRKRVTPRSASRSYVSRRSINAFAGFWNKKQKGEKAYVGDIAGKKLRTKNFETKRPVLTNPTANPYKPKKRIGDRAYKGPSGGYASRTQSGKAWRGDVAGRKIRGRNFTSKKSSELRGRPIHPPRKSKSRVGDRPYKGTMPGGGYQSVSGNMKKGSGQRLPARAPGIGANGIDKYRGNMRGGKAFSPQGAGYSGDIKSRRPLKGGGSVSGRTWNNKGQSTTMRIGGGDEARYQGNIKGGRPLKGGGSVSGKVWNNKGQSTTVRIGGGDEARYQGNIKRGRPVKGGGSVSGKVWNNKGQSTTVRIGGGDEARYQGNIKRGRPVKGGGSVSGKVWNNKQSPIPTRIPPAGAEKVAGFPGGYKRFDLKPGMRPQGEEFTGTMKARKPLKGGGSVSGKLWNNNGQPLTGKGPSRKIKYDTYQGNLKVNPKKEPSKEVGGFPGKQHQFDFHSSMRPQGEEFTGHQRLPRFKKGYVKNPNAADEALKKNRPDKSTYMVDGLQIKVKQQDYKQRPNAAKGAMPGIGPGKGSIKASEFSKGMKLRWNYKHNPNSADEALDAHEPSKAFARATDFQGNIKMKKFKFFAKKDLHPDAAFVKTNKNNVDSEKGVFTNFKLWWARVFKKSDTQPDHLKEKVRKPRYDKREEGLWYD